VQGASEQGLCRRQFRCQTPVRRAPPGGAGHHRIKEPGTTKADLVATKRRSASWPPAQGSQSAGSRNAPSWCEVFQIAAPRSAATSARQRARQAL